MKKMITLLLVLGMSLGLIACGNSAAQQTEVATSDSKTETTGTEAESTTEETETTDGASKSTLVVYFSATGNTKAAAEVIAQGTSGELYEIVPEEPYTDADLDWNDDNSRSTTEMNDASVRPAISGSIENFDQYDTVYIGYPIWWGEAPRIMDTFVESYDFTGKTVIPFCTSASSGIGSSASTLADLAGAGDWKEGERFGESESEDTIMEWVNAQ